MNIGGPDQESLDAFVRSEYRSDVKDLDFGSMAFDIAAKHRESDDEDSVEEEEETSSECDEANIHIPDLNNVVKNPEIMDKKLKDNKYSNYAKLNQEVQDLLILLDQSSVDVPDKFIKLSKKPNIDAIQLRQLKVTLSDLYDNHTTALYFTDWILQGAVMLSTIFDGEHAIPYLNLKLNLTGYATRLKKQTNELNKENIRVARKINKKIGKSTMSVFKWASLIILPAIITLSNNHGNRKMIDYEKHDALDSEDEEDEENGTSDAESEYESSE